jgi:hypothetical protein
MKRNAITRLIGNLAGLEEADPDFDAKVDRLIDCERVFPGLAAAVVKKVRVKIYQKYPITEELLLQATQAAAVEKMQEAGMPLCFGRDFLDMELNEEHRKWGTVKTFSPNDREAQTHFSNFILSRKTTDMRKAMSFVKRHQ